MVAGRWLLDKLVSLQVSESKLGLLDSKNFQNIDLILSLKANKAGRFVSVLGFHKTGVKGRTIICCPLKLDGNELDFYENLRMCLEGTKISNKVGLQKLDIGGEAKEIQNLKLSEGFKKRPTFL